VLAPLGVFRLGPEPCNSNSNSIDILCADVVFGCLAVPIYPHAQVQEAPKAQDAAPAAAGGVLKPLTVNAACQASLEVKATPVVQLVVQVRRQH